jgi:hypothetical protein
VRVAGESDELTLWGAVAALIEDRPDGGAEKVELDRVATDVPEGRACESGWAEVRRSAPHRGKIHKPSMRERERERETETETETDRDRDRQTDTQRERVQERERETSA